MKRFVLALALLTLAPGAALAADPPKHVSDPAAAQSLFYDARSLMQQGKYAEACPKLEESLRLDAGMGTQFNLADCNEHLGKLATAWVGFLDVASQAKIANQPERERLARKRAQAVEPKLPKVVVEISGATPGLTVKRDGVLIGPAAWGTPIPVDPGAHRISASAPGKQEWGTSVQALEAKTVRVSVPRDLPAAPVAARPAPVGTGTTTTAALYAPTDTGMQDFPPVMAKPGSTQRTLGWLIAGVGVVGVGVGAGFGLASLSSRDDSREHCSGDLCSPKGVSLRDDAMRSGNVATAATIAGGAALVGGLLLVLTAPKGPASQERAGKVRAVPQVAAGGGGFVVQGVFQ